MRTTSVVNAVQIWRRRILAAAAAVLTLPGLAVESDGRTAVLPLEAVRRIVRVQPDELVASGTGRAIVHHAKSMRSPMRKFDRFTLAC